MPTYEIYRRDGTPVQVEGPEGATTRQLINLYQEQQESVEEQSLAERRAARDEEFRRQFEDIQRRRPVTLGQQAQEVPKGILGGAANLLEQGALGLATLLPEDRAALGFLPSELATREAIQNVGDAVQSYLAPDANVQARIEEGKGAAIPRKFSEALGSFAGILGTALIPGVGLPAAAGLATAAGAGEASERARAAGASEEDRSLASLKGAGVGITELIPLAGPVGRILRRVPDEVRTSFANKAIDLGIATTAEGAQEALAATLQNMIEQGYNPEQVISEGVAEAGAYGAGVGFTVETLLRFLPRGRARPTPEPDPVEEKDATDEILAIGQEKPVALLTGPGREIETTTQKLLPAPTLQVTEEGQAVTPSQEAALEEQRADRPRLVTPEGQAVTGRQEAELDKQRADREATLADMPSAEVLGARTDLAEQAEPKPEPKPEPEVEPEPDPIATAATTDTAIGEQLSRALAEKEKTEQEKTKQKTTLTDRQLRDLQDDEAAAAQSLDDAFSAKPAPTREEVQLPLPGLKPTFAEKKRIRDKTIPDTTEPVTLGPQLREELIATVADRDPNVVTDGLLDRLGVSAKAPMRKRIVGKDVTTQDTDKDTGRVIFPIRQELVKFGNNTNVSKQTKLNISRYLANVDEAQGDLFDAKPDTKRGRTRPKDDPPTGGGTTTGAGKGPRRTAKTTPDRVDGTKPDAKPSDARKGRQDAPLKKKTKKEADFQPISSVVPQAAPNILFIPEKDVPTDAPIDDATGLPIVDVKKLQDKKKRTKVTKKETVDANTRAKEVFEKNVTEKNYGYTEELRKFNEKAGDTEVLYDDLPIGDKDKIIDLLESKPQRTRKIDITEQVGIDDKKTVVKQEQEKTLSYFVAQTLGKSPNIERSLDIAAWEVVNGPNSYKKTEKGEEVLSAGEVVFLATDGNQGKLAGTRVEQWVKQNLSPEGQRWFADRVSFYRAEISAFNTKERKKEERQEAQRKRQEAIDKQVEDEIKAEGFNSRQAMRELETYYREEGSKSSKLPLFLRTDAPANLDVPLHPMITSILGEGNLKSALNVLASGTDNIRVSAIAKALAKNMGNTKVVLTSDLTDADGVQVSGQFDPRTNTISINSSRPINNHVLLHESTHALTSATLANKSHPVTKQLTTLFNNVKDKLGDEYGTISLDEFVAETFSNPIFQRKLSTIHVNRQPASAFQRFMNTVSNMLRRLVGLNPKQADALSTANELIEGILAPSPEFRDANQLYLDTSIPSKAADALNNVASDSAIYLKNNNFYDYIQDGRGWLGSKIPLIVKKAWLSLQPVNILTELSESRIPGAKQLNTLVNNMSSALRKRNEALDPIIKDLVNLEKTDNRSYKLLESLVPIATYERIDPRIAKFEDAYGHKKGSDKYDPETAIEIHKDLRKRYLRMSKRGQDMYKVITNTFETNLSDVMDAVEANLAATVANPEGQKRVKDKLAELLNQERGTIKPFAPLTRVGRHRLKYVALDPQTNNVEVFVEYFKTQGQREKAKRKLQEYNQESLAKLPANDPRVAQIKNAKMEEGTNTSTLDYRNAPKGSFVYRVFEILDKEKVDRETVNKVVDLALDSMPERSFIQSFRERKDVRGFLGDVTPTGIANENFKLREMVEQKGHDYNRQLVQMEYGAKIQKFQREVLEQPLPPETTDATTALYKDRINKIANFAKSPDVPRWSQNLTAAGYAWTMGWNISSAAITTFDVIMSSAPRMAGKYGDVATTRAIGRATAILAKSPKTKMVKVMGPDGKMTNREVNTGAAGFSIGNYDYEKLKGMSAKDIQDAGMTKEQHQNLLDLETLSEIAKNNAQINQSLNQEELDMGNARDLIQKASAFSSFLFHHAERYNREVAMTSNYMLELKRLRDNPTKQEDGLSDAQKREQAAELAIRETEFTLGSTASAGRPIAAQSAIGNVAMLFKRFAVSKYHMMAVMTNDAFQAGGDATTKENRRIAQHQLARFLITTGLLTGIAGMPMMGALGMIYDVLFQDDDDDDFDSMIRKSVGEGFYKGLINASLGGEISSRVSMNSLLYRPPIIEKDQSLFFQLIEQLGGPVVGVYQSMDRGVRKLFGEGDVKGAVDLLPAAFKSVYKGGEQLVTGVGKTTRRGDAIVEDVGLFQIALQFAGFTNADLVAQYDYNRNEIRKRNALGSERSKLLRNFNQAITQGLVNGDYQAYQEALEDIQEYNRKLTPLESTRYIVLQDTLKRSLGGFQRRTAQTIGGIEYDPIMRQSLEEYDRGMRLFS